MFSYSTNAERDSAIIKLRESGVKYREIAQRFELTVERVRQICKREECAKNRVNRSVAKISDITNNEDEWVEKWLYEIAENGDVNCFDRGYATPKGTLTSKMKWKADELRKKAGLNVSSKVRTFVLRNSHGVSNQINLCFLTSENDGDLE